MTEAITKTAAPTSRAADLAERLQACEAKVIRTAESAHSACLALVGCEAGPELDRRLAALGEIAAAQHLNVTELKSVRAQLLALDRTETEEG